MKTIQVITQDGQRTVKALKVINRFAIHKTVMLGEDGPCYTITDLDTGKAFLKHLESVKKAELALAEIKETVEKHRNKKRCKCFMG